MARKPKGRSSPRRQVRRTQERADRTRELVINETMKCIHEEGFAAASTRHIIERAGVSTGVIQYHFGDRRGLLTAVVQQAAATLTNSINEMADKASRIADAEERMVVLAGAAWEAFVNPTSVIAMEILIATRSLRATWPVEHLADLQPGLTRIAELLGDSSPHAAAIADLLWAAPVGLMVAQMATRQSLPVQTQQDAMAQLIADHLRCQPPTDSS